MYGVTFHSEPSVVDKTELGLKLAKADLYKGRSNNGPRNAA